MSIEVSFWNEFLKVISISAILFMILFIAEMWRRLYDPPTEWTRKFVHISCGVVASLFPLVFSSVWSIFTLALLFFVLIVFVARPMGLLKSVYSIKRESNGDVYFIITVFFLFSVSSDRPLVFMISMMTLTLADAFAALVGKAYQKNIYRVEKHRKSLEGSVTFFIMTFLVVHLLLLLLSDVSRLQSVMIGLQIALVVACLEAICFNGFDNLVIPLSTYFLLTKLIGFPAHRIGSQLLIQLLIIGVINFFGWRCRFLTVSGAITAQLAIFGAYTLGGEAWVVPTVMAMVPFFSIHWFFRVSKKIDNPKSYQVLAVFYATLVPGLLYLADNFFYSSLATPIFLTARQPFFVPFVGAVGAHLTVGLLMLFWRHMNTTGWRLFPLAAILGSLSLIWIVPLSLLIGSKEIIKSDLLVTGSIIALAPTFLLFGLYHPEKLKKPEREYQLQMIAVGLAVLIVIPFYWMVLGVYK